VYDEPAREAMRLAARSGIVSGETGAACWSFFNCEGATDLDAYRRIMAK
jgi:hypothetical protein